MATVYRGFALMCLVAVFGCGGDTTDKDEADAEAAAKRTEVDVESKTDSGEKLPSNRITLRATEEELRGGRKILGSPSSEAEVVVEFTEEERRSK